jgi:hypothetical protein
MKVLSVFTLLAISLSALAAIQDGIFVGTNVETQGTCKIEFTDEGDYLYSRRSVYRITVHTIGPFINCEDYQGLKYPRCASGC